MEPAGRAFVAWRVPGGGVRAAVRDRPRGPWRVVPVAAGGRTDSLRAFTGAAAAMRGGTLASTLAWAEGVDGSWSVRVARRAGPGAAWSESPRPELPAGADTPSLAVAADGTIVAAWTAPATGAPLAPGALQAATSGARSPWTAPRTLSAQAVLPSAAAGYDGRAAVAWEERIGRVSTVTVAEAGIGTTWGAPEPVAPGQAPRVASTPGGDLVLSWGGESTADATPIRAVVRPAGTPWPAPRTLSPGLGLSRVEAWLARVAIGGTGRAFVAWLDPEGPGSATAGLAAARAGQAWQTAFRPVGGDGYGVGLSAATGGNGLALLPSVRDGGVVQAVDHDGYGRPVVTARLAGRQRADGTARWTAVVRNRGRFAARSVTLRLAICCGTALVATHPGGTRSGPQVVGASVAWCGGGRASSA